ncbi:MAG: IclR family transcriptional regulator [Sciscionella sp.]
MSTVPIARTRRLGPVGSDDSGGSEDTVHSVGNAIRVLDCFGTDAELGATAVAKRLGVAKSTASRILAALAAGGLLERGPRGRYRLGLKVFQLGQLAVDRLLLRELALPILAEVRSSTQETAQLGVPVGADVLYVDRLENLTTGLNMHRELYLRGPAHSSSAGKAIAALNPPMERAIHAKGLSRYTPFTIVDPARFQQALHHVRRYGYVASREEFKLGMSSVAAPVVVLGDDVRYAVAAISLAGPTSRVLGPRKPAMIRAVVRGAQQLSAVVARTRAWTSPVR